MTMTSALLTITVTGALGLGAAQTQLMERPVTTPDGRFGTRCYNSGIENQGEVCKVSFARLISSPEVYHGRRITVVGFLFDAGEGPELYPSSESLRSGLTIESIELANVPPQSGYRSEDYRKGRRRTAVTGVFDAHFVGLSLRRLGMLHDVSRIYDATMPLGDLDD